MATIRVELINNSKTIRVVDLTDYTSHPDARGVLIIEDPNGQYIVNNSNFDNPDITVGSPVSAEFPINLVGGVIPEGIYSVEYNVDYDEDDDSDDLTEMTFEYDTADLVSIAIEMESSLTDETIQSTDISDYTGNVTLDSRTHALTDPTDVVSSSSDKDTNTTIALTELRTGEYSSEITSGITIKINDTFWIIDSINGTEVHDVWGVDGISSLAEGMTTLYDRYKASIATDNGRETEALETVVSQVNSAYSLYKINRDHGSRDDASLFLNEIKALLSAEDITIIEPESKSLPVVRLYPGFAYAWYFDSGVPSDDIGRNGDGFFRTDTNNVYKKASDTWGDPVGTLGGNALIEFSADGSTGWTSTYSNGLNYIRFSGNGGADWTVASKFIDGYVYFAYASDDAGAGFICTDDPSFTFNPDLAYIATKKFPASHAGDLVAGDFTGLFSIYHLFIYYAYASNDAGAGFICTDDPGFTFNPVLEYIALKKFDEFHNGDLVAGDFTGLFTKYRDNGIIAYCSTPSISIPTDADGDNALFPTSEKPSVYVYDGDIDVTSNWNITIDETVYVTATIVNDNEISITDINSDIGSIKINCDRSGYDTLNILVLVHMTKAGQAVVEATSLDNLSIDITNTYGRVGDLSFISSTANPNITKLDYKTIAYIDGYNHDLRTYQYKVLNQRFELVGNELNIVGAGEAAITTLDSNTIAYLDNNFDSLRTYSWDGTDWSLVGSGLSITLGSVTNYDITALSSTRIAFLYAANITTYDWNGSIWSKTGNTYDIETAGDGTFGWNFGGHGKVAAINSTQILVVEDAQSNIDQGAHLMTLTFDGTDWLLDEDSVASEGLTGEWDVDFVGFYDTFYNVIISITKRVGSTSNTGFSVWEWEDGSPWETPVSTNIEYLSDATNSLAILSAGDRTSAGSRLAFIQDGNNRLELYTPFLANDVHIEDEGVKIFHLSDNVITEDNLNDYVVTGAKLAAAVAGDGLGKDGSENLEVNVDDSTIEIDTDALRLKDSGITSAKLDPAEINGKFLPIGTGFYINGGGYRLAMTWLDITSVAVLTNQSDKLRTYTFNGTTWAIEGSDFTVTGMGNIKGMCHLNIHDTTRVPRIVMIDSGNDELRTYEFTAGTWSQLGSSLSVTLGTVYSLSLVRIAPNRVALLANGGSSTATLTTYDWNGSVWSSVGTPLTGLQGSSDVQTQMTKIGDENKVVVWSQSYLTLTTYEFNGSVWTQVGEHYYCTIDINNPMGDTYITNNATNINEIFLFNERTDEAHRIRWNGVNWQVVGQATSHNVAASDVFCTMIDGTIVHHYPGGNIQAYVNINLY